MTVAAKNRGDKEMTAQSYKNAILNNIRNKLKLIIVASPRARTNTSSPLLRLVRDYSEVLRQYQIHSTGGTGRIILSTGVYEKDNIVLHRSGEDGGVAELAGVVARGECAAVIFLLDPSDPWSETVENRALKRVCIQRQIRLITTYAAAEEWMAHEALLDPQESRDDYVSYTWKPTNWRPGNRNIGDQGNFQRLQVGQRSIALISHDKKKLEMVRFVNEHLDLLVQHDRILTTGTTGWVLKLLLASGEEQNSFIDTIRRMGKEDRLILIFDGLLRELDVLAPSRAGLEELIKRLKVSLQVSANADFTNKVMPLPSGPDGGDVLVANEALNNQCHTIVFFHDPLTAHPHNDDIRLLERTCQLSGVFATCVSDRKSASNWIEGLREEIYSKRTIKNLARELRQKYNLREVLLVTTKGDQDSDELGQALTRACAGYLNHYLHNIIQEGKETRIGIAWGWVARKVIEEIKTMEKEGILEKPPRFPDTVVWSPLIGITTAEITEREASSITQAFRDFYGGTVQGISCAGFAREGTDLPAGVEDLIDALEKADIILTSASPWNREAALYKNTGLNHEYFPDFSDAAGTISGIFLNHLGEEVKGQYSIVGLDYHGFRRAAELGKVILIAGGYGRRQVALGALRGRLVSVLITTQRTGEWILNQ